MGVDAETAGERRRLRDVEVIDARERGPRMGVDLGGVMTPKHTGAGDADPETLRHK